MEFNDLVEFIEKVTTSKCTRLYYCVHGKTLNTGLRVINFDLDIYRFLDHEVANGGHIALYIDHYNENLMDFIGKDNLTDLLDVNMTTNDIDVQSSDDSYQSRKEEDEVSNSISSDHEDNHIMIEQGIKLNDPFLSLLCYDNIDGGDVEEDVNSAKDWSVNNIDDDSDGVEEFIERDVEYPNYDPSINWKLTKPVQGMKFESPTQLKESMIDYGVANGYQLEFPVNDHRRLLVRCGKQETNPEEDEGIEKTTNKKRRKCPFKLWASIITGEGSFQIKRLNEKHSKKKALQDYEGGLKEHYAKLSDYRAEILRTNPGSTINMVVNTMSSGNNYFSSYYICFKGVKDGWIKGCRKIISFDGCFLKGVCDGQLLAAMGRDANNQIFPLAWAVVSVENKENWKWFVNLLSEDIGMKEGFRPTIISDQHKGILEAVKDIFPYVEHRQSNPTVEQHFEEKMNEIKAINKEAYTHLVERNPKSWSRAFFEVGRARDAFENGMSESFNLCIRAARRKPIITMLEEIKIFVMQRFFRMSILEEKVEHDGCPTIRKKIELLKVKQRHWSVIPSDYNQFEARNEHTALVVDINEHGCSCRSWQLLGIPCILAIAALAFLNKDPEIYVNNWLKKDMLKEAYKYPIKPLNGSSLWPKTDDIKPLPPKERRMPSRPTIKRKRDACEKEIKHSKVRIGRKMTCQNCQEKGHNIKSFKKQMKGPQPREVRPKGRPKKVDARQA
ncbi:hypothetical protein OSB04_011617 [Centaurea solstitialis]|uniref:SWIM-type domain-containing protein n=1 Tax=Centaurea solstitialis TaxID=347529 RepID=A0AA38TUI2_9ASTR|nr:hypothetical protein OSB04_011617 [Centaurea solstitialis]